MRPLRGVPRMLVGAVVLVLGVALLRSCVLDSYVIPSASMQPTLQVGDRIAVNRLAYRLGDLRRGDVVVFDGSGLFAPREDGGTSGLASVRRMLARVMGSRAGSHMFVKRVIGLPGDHVTCCDASGRITVDGESLDEPYIAPGEEPSLQRFDVVVPPGRIWVMGDHRRESADSRAHLGDPGGGTVPVTRIVGQAEVVYWPPGRAGRLRTPADQDREDRP